MVALMQGKEVIFNFFFLNLIHSRSITSSAKLESTRKMRGSSYAPSTSFYTRSASPQNSGRRRGAPLRSKLLISNFRRTPAISGWTDSSASFTQRFPKAGTSRTSSARGPSAWRTHSAFWLSAASPTKVNCVVCSIYRVRRHLFFLVSVPPLAMSLMSRIRYQWCQRQHWNWDNWHHQFIPWIG